MGHNRRRLLVGRVVRHLREAFRVYRTHLAQMKYHRHLLSIAEELRPQLMSNLEILPNREHLLMNLPGNDIVAEIGVAEGDYSSKILELCTPAKLHLIDLWSERRADDRCNRVAFGRVIERFSREIGSGQVEVHRGCSWEVIPEFRDEYFGWVYIDASHDYESVRKDLTAVMKKVRKGGFICGHDYVMWCGTPPGRAGVVEAVNEFCNHFGYEMLYLTNEANRHVSYALRRLQGGRVTRDGAPASVTKPWAKGNVS